MTDGDGTKSFAEANVTVLSDQDLPPVASAGGPVVVQLPVNEAVLMGNYSTDDKVPFSEAARYRERYRER